MEQYFKPNIPKPCHEDWDKMTPTETGRFCGSCTKNVVDFTGMKAKEISDYFVKHQDEKVCGRFQNEQLDSVIITIPRAVIFSQTQFHKMFLLALFVSMGTVLFSCSDKDGNKQSINRIEVTESQESVTTGAPLPPKNYDSLGLIPPTKSTVQKPAKAVFITKPKPVPLMGDVIVEPHKPKVTVYKDSITMSGAE